MEHNKDIICPDCELYTIHTPKEIQNNRCEKCSKRYRAATIMRSSRGLLPLKYIKIKDIKDTQEYVDFYNNYINMCNKKSQTNKTKTITESKAKRSRISVQLSKQVKDFLKEVTDASDAFTTKQLYLLVKSKFPEYTTSYNSFVKYISFHKFPHYTVYGAQNIDKEIMLNVKDATDIILPQDIEVQSISQVNETNIEQFNNHVQKDVKFEDKCKNIQQELQKTLNRKYNKLGCPIQMKYSIDELLHTFEILYDLKCNSNTYINSLSKQHYAADGLQNDIVHEIENEIPIEGDNTLQVKLHILRDIRRDLEFSNQCITNIKPFIDSLNCTTQSIQNVIKSIENLKRLRQNPIYIPRVDMSIPDRYEWGVQPSSANSICSTNEIIKCELDPNEPCYEFRCELSGGGYGVYKPYKRRYILKDPDKVMQQGEKDVAKYIQGKKGVLISNKQVIKIN